MTNLIYRFKSSQSGATAIEYGLIAGLISVTIIVAATQIGTDISALFTFISGKMTAAGS